jgi:hypothetical protein
MPKRSDLECIKRGTYSAAVSQDLAAGRILHPLIQTKRTKSDFARHLYGVAVMIA